MQLDPAAMPARDIYALMTDVIVPRPIALVSTVSPDGQPNLAPFSYFVGLSSRPPLVGISIGRRAARSGAAASRGPALGTAGWKDTAWNVLQTRELVINVTTEDVLSGAVLASGDYPPEVDELELSDFTPVPSECVRPPRIAESPVALECRLDRHVDLHGSADFFIAEILRFHVAEETLTDAGRVSPSILRPVGRLGANLYSRLGELLTVDRPQ